ncbi:hypothetical protein GF407_02085 [candidate division KSB1 bacterium]|nr:hypothetical protein [candidate division KSB1 bacterium]
MSLIKYYNLPGYVNWLFAFFLLIMILPGRGDFALPRSLQFSRIQLERPSGGIALDGEWELRAMNGDSRETVVLPSYLDRVGHFTLIKTFRVDSSASAEEYLFHIGGIEGQCSVYLNHQFIGGRALARFPFTLSAGAENVFTDKQNQLSIEVDNRLDYKETIPLKARLNGLPIHGKGVLGSVELVPLSTPFTKSVLLDSIEISGNRLLFDLNLKLRSPENKAVVARIQLLTERFRRPLWQQQHTISSPAARDGDEFMELGNISVPFYPWQPGSPHFYTLEVRLWQQNRDDQSDVFRVDFGVPATNEPRVPEDIRAIGYVLDKQLAGLSPDTLKARLFDDLRMIKQMGANTVYCYASYPLPPFLSVCDELGLYALVELPLADIPTDFLKRQSFIQLFENHLHRFIETFKVHPSVLAWGLGNGFAPDHPLSQSFVRRMVGKLGAWDGRPVYLSPALPATSPSLGADFYIVDVIDQNNQPDETALSSLGRNVLPRIVAAVEIGEEDQRYLEKHHAHKIREIFADLSERSWKGGLLVSPIYDWYGDACYSYWGAGLEMDKHITGLINADGVERPAFQVVRSFFSSRSLIDILYEDVPPESSLLFQILALTLFALFLLLLKNDKRLQVYLKRVYRFPHGFIVDLQENRKVNAFLTLYVGTTLILSLAIIFSSWIYCLKDNFLFGKVLIYLFSEPESQRRVIQLIWHPLWLLFFLFVVLFAGIVFSAALLRIYFFITKRTIYFRQTFSFCVWINSHILFTLPLAIVFIKAYQAKEFHLFINIYLVVILLWTIGRYFRGFRLFLQLGFLQTSMVIGVVLLFVLSAGYYLHIQSAFISYLRYFLMMIGS